MSIVTDGISDGTRRCNFFKFQMLHLLYKVFGQFYFVTDFTFIIESFMRRMNLRLNLMNYSSPV